MKIVSKAGIKQGTDLGTKPGTRPRSRLRTVIVATALATTLATTLSGCFVISVIDGRSPFDDPFGVSKSQVRQAMPVLQAALDEVDVGADWKLVASYASDNCEGDCNLRLLTEITPTDALLAGEITRSTIEAEAERREDDSLFPPSEPLPGESVYLDLVVPDEVWRAASFASIQAAEEIGIDVTVEGGFAWRDSDTGPSFTILPNECPAVEASLGVLENDYSVYDPEGRFNVSISRDISSCEVTFSTSKFSGLGTELGL